ncbi:type VI secretion system baseplate subunit TssK [Vibrio profundum]|uniref:type VI secretion system baseplate subunit TssK n=1 Tax=Vibrio profundum TaxID=2910247 RepID=UPI003D122CD1
MNQPLYWHQGLLLQPQHFQLESQFHQWQQSQTRTLTQNYAWGLVSLTVNNSALLDKQLVIQKCQALFPDGSLCELGKNAVVASRQFDDTWLEMGKKFPVYLGLRRWQDSGNNVTEVDEWETIAQVQSRYATLANPIDMVDLYGSGASGQVKPLNYMLKIFWQDELDSAGDYHLMPLCQLERDGQRILVSEEFLPPVTDLKQWPVANGLLRDVLDQLVSRAKQLEKFKKPTAFNSMTSSDIDVTLTLAMRSLNRCACQVQCLLESPILSPWHAWQSFCEILAELSSFVTDYSVAGEAGVDRWPEYDHLTLYEVFSCCQRQLSAMLDSMVVGPEYVLTMECQHGVWQVSLPTRALQGQYSYWLWLDGADDGQFEIVSSRIKVAASNQLTSLMVRAVSGIPLLAYDETPPGLPRSEGGLYCRLDNSSPLWQQVLETKNLGLCGLASEHMNVKLFITRGEK